MKTLNLEIKGTCPLLQHDDKLVNHFSENTKRFKALSTKKHKDEADLKEMTRIEWLSSLYHTPQKGYFIKAECFEGAFYAAAKTERLGKLFKQAASIPDDPIFHFPDETLTPEELFTREQYVNYASVKIQHNKIFRCRPIFNEWHCAVQIVYNEELIDAGTLQNIAEYAGRFVGICDFRPKYGRFEVVGAKEINDRP